ncbi:MAG: amidohydrolase family protein [Pseudomonadota bacterium]
MHDYLIKAATIVDGTGEEAYTGDIAIADGIITEVGQVDGKARETIDADGAIAAPGWVDVHTHYDGQVTWDDAIDPSFSHGVTSVVMGNCGVGFAPVHAGGEKQLIELMEGVEDIPGTALYEGMPWGAWESFPEYMDFLASRKFALDVGAQLAHGALRYFVMGDRGLAHEAATADDLAQMATLTEAAMRAGAMGFSTSRTIGHRAIDGNPVPGTFAEEDELLVIAEAMRKAGSGVFEMIPAAAAGDMLPLGGEKYTTLEEFALIKRLASQSGRPFTFTQVQIPDHPEVWREVLALTRAANQQGSNIRPQIASRPIGLVTSLSTYHMFQQRPSYLAIKDLPLTERVKRMSQPDVRAAILSEDDVEVRSGNPMATMHRLFQDVAPHLYAVNLPIDYEPDPSKKFGELAAATNQNINEYVYDFLLENDGHSFAILLGANYVESNHDAIAEMMQHPDTVTGLSDAGAHVNLIFDAVAPTYQLTHWVRDRNRGARLPIELVVHKQTKNNAELYGLHDRGEIAPGKRADLNLIDLPGLTLGGLEVHNDLPAGGSRILQPASGYLGTWLNGVRTRENDVDTGARPGRLMRAC